MFYKVNRVEIAKTIMFTSIGETELRMVANNGEVEFSINNCYEGVEGLSYSDKKRICVWWLRAWNNWVSLDYPGLPGDVRILRCHPTTGDKTDRFSTYAKHGWNRNRSDSSEMIHSVRGDEEQIQYDLAVESIKTTLRNIEDMIDQAWWVACGSNPCTFDEIIF